MSSSLFALLWRSLRVDVRSRGTHLSRLALVLGIYLALFQVQLTAAWLGAPGLSFFKTILWLNMVFVTLMGIGVFTSVITEEKEEDALGLLRMAGIDSLGLLLGKVGGRLVQSLALLVVQFPFALLSITLGGVSMQQVWAAYVSQAAYLVMLAGLGAFCSTVSSTSRKASRLTVLLLLVYGVVCLVTEARVRELTRTGGTSPLLPAMRFLVDSCVFLQMDAIQSTGYAAALANVQVVSNVLAGLLFFALAWRLFEICSRVPRTEPLSRGLVTYKARGFRWFSPGRPRMNPLVWKDFYFAAGGIAGLLVRAMCYSGLFALAVTMFGAISLKEACQVFLMILLAALPFDASLLISKAMQDEVRGLTIPSLVMLPRSVPAIVYAKLGGALLGLLPGLAAAATALVCSGLIPEFLADTSGWERNMGLLMVTPYLLLLPHLTAVIALVVRWGATPVALGAAYAVQMAESMLLLVPMMLLGSFGNTSVAIYFGCMAILNVALCVACHFEVMRRFRKLAEK